MLLDSAVEPVARGVRLLDDLGWRKDPDDAVYVTPVLLVVVEAGLVTPYAAILVIAFNPGYLFQDIHVGDVLGAAKTLVRYRVVSLDIEDENVSCPLLTHLLQQHRRIGAVRQVDLDIAVDLMLKIHCVSANHRGQQQ